MEHIIYRTRAEKEQANALSLRQASLNCIAKHIWFSRLHAQFAKIKELNINLWYKFHAEHCKTINALVDREAGLPRALKVKIKHQCEILIQSLKYFYLVYLRVQNERYVNDIIQDQDVGLANLVWLPCGMVDRQRSLTKLILPILNEFNTSNLFTIGYKFCLPPLLLRVYHASDCKLGKNLHTNDVHSFLYIYFIRYCQVCVERSKQSQKADDSLKLIDLVNAFTQLKVSEHTNTSSHDSLKLSEHTNTSRHDTLKLSEHTNTSSHDTLKLSEHTNTSREDEEQSAPYMTENSNAKNKEGIEHTSSEETVSTIVEDSEFKAKHSTLFKATQFVDMDWLVLMDQEHNNVFAGLLALFDIDRALAVYSFVTRNKMSFEYFWNRVHETDKQALCDHIVGILQFTPSFQYVFYFLVMYEYLPLSFQRVIQNNEPMRKLHQLSILNDNCISLDTEYTHGTLHSC